MAGNEIDRVRGRSALEVIRQHPVMALFVASPVLLAAVVVGVLTNAAVGILVFVLAALAGTWVIVRKR